MRDPPKLNVVVATGNRHKVAELRALLEDLPVRLLGFGELSASRRPEMPDEDGETFEQNADIKARHVARTTGFHALADDSGFEVQALGNRPGVLSARFAGMDGAREVVDVSNNRKLIAEARIAALFRQPTPPAARFRCVLSFASPDGRVLCRGEGTCEGVLVEEARGTGGFGYDPHFLVPELGLTFAEIGPEEKNRISHRARAMQDLRSALVPLIPTLLDERRPRL